MRDRNAAARATAQSLLDTAGSACAGSAWETDSKLRWADMDGDGHDDYVVLADNGSVWAWLNRGGDGHGGWQAWTQVATGVTTNADQVRFARVDARRQGGLRTDEPQRQVGRVAQPRR